MRQQALQLAKILRDGQRYILHTALKVYAICVD